MEFLPNLILLLSAVTLIFANPVQERFSIPITVQQTPYPGPGSIQIAKQEVTGECINVQYNNIASEIRLIEPLNNPEPFKIAFFLSPCEVQPRISIRNESLPESGAVIVNRRNPVCSFKLNTTESNPVDVTFYYGTGGNQTFSVSNNEDCKNMCSSTDTISNYPHSVAFTRNGIPTEINNDIHLFKRQGCLRGDEYAGVVNLQQQYNLLKITNVTNEQVKSFMIFQDIQ
ncbi:unnamed protein product [Orchesella dallaii]|uniref:Uncharacterized protein n=1 Tax=Orchesella dallaii TaxID=48710 RepID=A0ABP1RKA2_9HEXA